MLEHKGGAILPQTWVFPWLRYYSLIPSNPNKIILIFQFLLFFGPPPQFWEENENTVQDLLCSKTILLWTENEPKI